MSTDAPLDELSFIYFIRTLPLTADTTFEVSRHFDATRNPIGLWILGRERVIVSDVAGTTRDAIDTELDVDGRRIRLVDTAGIRRQSKVQESVEYYTTLRSQRAAERADVALVVCDATDGVTSQDLRIAELAMKAGCATALVLNKWDLTGGDVGDGLPDGLLPGEPAACGGWRRARVGRRTNVPPVRHLQVCRGDPIHAPPPSPQSGSPGQPGQRTWRGPPSAADDDLRGVDQIGRGSREARRLAAVRRTQHCRSGRRPSIPWGRCRFEA